MIIQYKYYYVRYLIRSSMSNKKVTLKKSQVLQGSDVIMQKRGGCLDPDPAADPVRNRTF